MRIVVCIKQVPDPEGPAKSFVINSETLSVEPKGIPPVQSLFDENALEAALRIKESDPENITVSIVSAGKRVSNAVLQKGLAVGADELVKIEDDRVEEARHDSYSISRILAAAIQKLEQPDIIMVGRQAADWNAGQVGSGIASLLDIPLVTLARKVDITEAGTAIVERIIPGGFEKVSVTLPAVIMASNEAGQLRYPTMIQRREAKKKPVTAWNCGDIDFTEHPQLRMILHRLYNPELKKSRCNIIDGEDPTEAGRKLALRLKEDSLL